MREFSRDVNETLHDETETIETETLMPRDEARPSRSKKRLESAVETASRRFETETISLSRPRRDRDVNVKRRDETETETF
jgi:hypothetical protein